MSAVDEDHPRRGKVRLQSFTKASKTLHVSQPSVSKIIRQFEDREAVRLLERTRRSVRLTQVGEIYFRKCELIFREIEKLRGEVESRKNQCVGDLSIGASDNLCNYILPSILAEFSERYPQVMVRLFSGASSEIKTDMMAGRSEVGLFYTEPRENHFEVKRIGQMPFVIVCAANSRRGFGSKADPAILASQPRIGCGRVEYVRSFPVIKMLKSLDIESRHRFECNSMETQKRWVMLDQGYGVFPRFMVEQEVQQGVLRILKTPKPIGSPVHFVARRGKELSRPALLFSAFMERAFRG